MAGTDKANRALEARLADAKARLADAELAGDRRATRRARHDVEDLTAKLVVDNMDLVHRFAGAFSDSDDEEYANAGRLALVESVLRWDPAKGALSTWAFPRIKKAILAEVARVEHRLNSHAFVARGQVHQALAALRRDLGREPTDEEVSAYSSVALSLVRQLRLNDAAGKTRSLNKVVGDDGTELGAIAGPVVDSAEDMALDLMSTDGSVLPTSALRVEDMAARLEHCSILEVAVGLRRQGADGGECQDFQELAGVFGKSRETLRKAYASYAAKTS